MELGWQLSHYKNKKALSLETLNNGHLIANTNLKKQDEQSSILES